MADSGRPLDDEGTAGTPALKRGEIDELEADVDELEGPIVARLYVPDLAALTGWATHEVRRPPAARDRRLGFRR